MGCGCLKLIGLLGRGDRYGFLSLMLNHVVLQLLTHLESRWIKGHTAVELSQISYVSQRFSRLASETDSFPSLNP